MRKTKNHHTCLKCGFNRNYTCTNPQELCKDCIKFVNDNPGNKLAKEYLNGKQLELSDLCEKTKEVNKNWHRKTTFKPRKVLKGIKLIVTSEEVIVQGSLVYCKCSNCGKILHLESFGTRDMGDGIIRNQPQCWECR